MRVILITGGAGFIGSHVCKLLARNGIKSVVVDSMVRGNRQSVRWSDCILCDINNTDRLHQVILDNNITEVIHFAALAYVRESIQDPLKYWRSNVAGTLSLLEAMAGTSVKRLIFSSSCATYGIPESIPIILGSPTEPINPYGQTKLVCEKLIADAANRLNLKTIALRYFNVAGSDPDLEIGEVHDPETHIIPILLLKAMGLEGSDPVRIFGNDHDTPDGTCVRDYIHVMDLARAHLAAMDYLRDGGESAMLNVGLGKGTSILELIRICEKATGNSIDYNFEPKCPGDPPTLVADPGDTWKLLGIQPQWPNVEDMVRHSRDWFREQRGQWLSEKIQAMETLNSA